MLQLMHNLPKNSDSNKQEQRTILILEIFEKLTILISSLFYHNSLYSTKIQCPNIPACLSRTNISLYLCVVHSQLVLKSSGVSAIHVDIDLNYISKYCQKIAQ